ncbi:uncharacterized protein DS421_12g379690 [Arachis hypogaea]|nr:uncharacterized protein DS421_12g379690 [Arachis hypogaea]
MFYVIDELDNCLVLEVIRKNDQLLITDSSFKQIRTFYFINRGVSVQFRYVGFGNFFLFHCGIMTTNPSKFTLILTAMCLS